MQIDVDLLIVSVASARQVVAGVAHCAVPVLQLAVVHCGDAVGSGRDREKRKLMREQFARELRRTQR